MDATRLNEIEARCKAATPGRWLWYNGCSWWRLGVADTSVKRYDSAVLCPEVHPFDGVPSIGAREGDKEFIEHSSVDVPDLVQEVRRLQGGYDQSPFSAMACPGCVYVEGVFQRRCGLHAEIDRLTTERDGLREALEGVLQAHGVSKGYCGICDKAYAALEAAGRK